ncbi:hypothetical protein Salat_2853600 [Sesamum alatum]|uniref:DC1 domain-containing protein n=1 Tax=Sesamum alatum TaxID=300844 RepID=A0AAE1XN36_9LAMI|nr:hypothetical protein Salat_2853600 [Sesamum alatum]
MGKPNADPSNQTPIIHFSHPHPLQLQNLPPLAHPPPCSACKLDAAGTIYTCIECNFLLHPKCYQLPQQIKHPFDQNHALSLHPKPVYPEGLFSCDACGNQGDGFSYHCSPCGVDLHTTCASLPMNFTHHCHHHSLCLTFSAPYPGNTFSCDVCKRTSSGTWIYRCSTCEFDVHLTCVATVIQPAPKFSATRSVVPPQPSGVFMNPTNTGVYGAPVLQPVVVGQPQGQFLATPYNNMNQPGYGAVRPVNGGGLGGQLAVAAVSGLTGGIAQSATQALLQGVFGGDGSGGGGGGDGGGGVSYVEFMGNGGGGGITDGGAYYDGGADGGYAGGDGSIRLYGTVVIAQPFQNCAIWLVLMIDTFPYPSAPHSFLSISLSQELSNYQEGEKEAMDDRYPRGKPLSVSAAPNFAE